MMGAVPILGHIDSWYDVSNLEWDPSKAWGDKRGCDTEKDTTFLTVYLFKRFVILQTTASFKND